MFKGSFLRLVETVLWLLLVSGLAMGDEGGDKGGNQQPAPFYPRCTDFVLTTMTQVAQCLESSNGEAYACTEEIWIKSRYRCKLEEGDVPCPDEWRCGYVEDPDAYVHWVQLMKRSDGAFYDCLSRCSSLPLPCWNWLNDPNNAQAAQQCKEFAQQDPGGCDGACWYGCGSFVCIPLYSYRTPEYITCVADCSPLLPPNTKIP